MSRHDGKVCRLSSRETIATERDGILPDCRNHKHKSKRWAVEKICSGRAKEVRHKRIDGKPAIYEFPAEPEKPLGEYRPMHVKSRTLMGLRTFQIERRER